MHTKTPLWKTHGIARLSMKRQPNFYLVWISFFPLKRGMSREVNGEGRWMSLLQVLLIALLSFKVELGLTRGLLLLKTSNFYSYKCYRESRMSRKREVNKKRSLRSSLSEKCRDGNAFIWAWKWLQFKGLSEGKASL